MSRFRRDTFRIAWGCCLAFAPASASAQEPSEALWPGASLPSPDPVVRLVHRMDRYFESHEVSGVTIDSRFDINPPEAIRMSVICQLLGYAELQRARPCQRLREDITTDGDYLLAHLAEIRSHTPFDGMLGYALLSAWEATGASRFRDAARSVVDEMLAVPTQECVLNGGLMVAMATGKHFLLTGHAPSATRTHDILAQLLAYQNADGSFPHWCQGSRDIHYTGWMAHELVHLGRMTDDPVVPLALARMSAFMADRIAADGRSRYEAPCPGVPGCFEYYDSRRTGCSYDYDTRGWTVEPGYQLLLFDHTRSTAYRPVMKFLLSLEANGTFPDLYDYWPPPEDPEYPWTTADTSVANMSIVFWSLATIVSARPAHELDELGWQDERTAAPETIAAPEGGAVTPAAWLPLRGHPSHGVVRASFLLREAMPCSVNLLDVQGRRMREVLPRAERAAGAQVLDVPRASLAPGVYVLELRARELVVRQRVVLLP